MTSSSDRSLPAAESINPATPSQVDGFLSVPSADLVLTHDDSGQCLSFFWKDAERYGVKPEQWVGQSLADTVAPLGLTPYLDRVRQVLDYLLPLRFEYPFYCAGKYLVFDLTISPILMPHGTATTVVATGQFRYLASEATALEIINALLSSRPSLHSDRHHKRITQVIWNIRRSLDLQLIWQQTVDGLGEALDLSRCLIGPYQPDCSHLEIVAEYRHPSLPSLLGTKLSLDEPYLAQALASLRPIAVSAAEPFPEPTPSILAIATCYQDQPNGIIILHEYDRARLWSDVEIDLLREVADQVGTGIAHASLFEESRNMAAELQRVNESLMQQHSDLEEARQQAEAASRLKSEFLANTSHELRTPLNGVIGFLKLILDGMADDPEEQQQFIQEAYRSAIHLLHVINDILDIAKIEAGKMQLDLNPIRLDDLLNEVENFMLHQAQQKNLGFEIRTPATRDEVILYGNYQRLLQVLLNLVGNAIKFTHEGSVTISAEVLPGKVVVQGEEKPGSVKISVADTGIGVSLEKQDKLFQSFSQVDGSRTRQYGGTGLGLAISQKLVEAMGGVVNFFSMGEGLGSTVTFTVPLYQDPVMITAPLADSADLLL
ncbi:MAG: GAF domain-containing protein [Synechococcales cyanobacterium C42_A2020_086]|nr:GAF domain-containing protein [Synechococcales cyanobacterium C42_A2020_086]